MYIIIGLGNPGRKYEGTRHNVGFRVIDHLSEILGIPLDFEKHRALCGKGKIEGESIILAKPLTYMNLSGSAVAELISYYKADPLTDLIIISDDIDLETGRIRIRTKGSAGGHNGLKNIISLLNTNEFQRVKVGVGEKPREWDLADWVLSRFSDEDMKIMDEAEIRAARAVVCIIKDGVNTAMNQFNGVSG